MMHGQKNIKLEVESVYSAVRAESLYKTDALILQNV